MGAVPPYIKYVLSTDLHKQGGAVCADCTRKRHTTETLRYIIRMGPLRASAALLVTFGAKSDRRSLAKGLSF